MTKGRIALIVLVIFLSLVPFKYINATENYKSKESSEDFAILKQISKADPKKEFKKAIAKKDYRFMGVYGYTLMVPGVPDYDVKYSKKYKVWGIPGTSDAALDVKHWKLIKKVKKYAEAYNKLLKDWIDKHDADL